MSSTPSSLSTSASPSLLNPLFHGPSGTHTIVSSSSTFAAQFSQVQKALPGVQKGLLIATVACATISLIPPLRLAGTLALRVVAFLSSSANCAEQWSKDTPSCRFLKCIKMTAVAIGLLAVAASSAALVVVSLIANIGIQVMNLMKNLYQGNYSKALIHFGMIIIDSLVLAAMLTHAWELMVAAAAVSALAMLIIGYKIWSSSRNSENIIETACYILLGGLGIASALTSTEIIVTQRTVTGHRQGYIYAHETEKYGLFRRPDGNFEIIQPGWQTIPVYEYKNVVLNTPLAFKDFPTLPISGTSIVTKELS